MRARISGLAFVAILCPLLAPLGAGCFSSAEDCNANLSCRDGGTVVPSEGGDTSPDVAADTKVSNPDTSTQPDVDAGPCAVADPGQMPCAIDERFGVFVSPRGTATGAGTRSSPLASVAAAVKIAAASNKRVYACADAGTYNEVLTFDTSVDGLMLYGGFSCTGVDWSYSTTLQAKLAPTTAGVVLTATKLARGLRVEDFAFTAADASISGASSIAAFIDASAGVVFQRVAFSAGNGAAGAGGTSGADGSVGPAPAAGQQGLPALCASAPQFQPGGAWSSATACGSSGGAGGEAFLASDGSSGGAGVPNVNVTPPNVNNGGVNGTSGGAGSFGTAGAMGTAPAPGAFTEGAYAVASGGAGASGHPGQGGGGGGSSSAAGNATCIGASGGAGGEGGCGGVAGSGGQGGGASVALFTWSSPVTLMACVLTSKSGGSGGAGGSAGYGGAGGRGGVGGLGAGHVIGNGGDGGTGGAGGDGGSGGGGSGGPSYAVVHYGASPAMGTDTTLTHGAGGTHGIGGALHLDPARKAPDGTDGDSAAVHTQP